MKSIFSILIIFLAVQVSAKLIEIDGVEYKCELAGSTQGFYIVADCWLDDDPDFDFDQTFHGEIYGNTTDELERICLAAAKGNGANWTSGIKNIKQEIGDLNYYLKSHCWLDDDADFDFDQTFYGTVYGSNVEEMKKTCQAIALGNGSQWTSGLKVIQQTKGIIQIGYEADCWLDDDPDFDFDQTFHGQVFGNTVEQMKNICSVIAKGNGSQWTSGIKNIKQTIEKLP